MVQNSQYNNYTKICNKTFGYTVSYSGIRSIKPTLSGNYIYT